MRRIRADLIVCRGYGHRRQMLPIQAGVALANALLAEPDWDSVEIDLRRCDPATLISAFYVSMFGRILAVDHSRLERVKSFVWLTDHDFQQKMISRILENYFAGVSP